MTGKGSEKPLHYANALKNLKGRLDVYSLDKSFKLNPNIFSFSLHNHAFFSVNHYFHENVPMNKFILKCKILITECDDWCKI